MAHTLRYLTAFLSLGLTFLRVHAQSQPTPLEQRVRVTVFSSRPAAGLGYVPHAGQAATPLLFYPTARSSRYEYRGAMPLRIVDLKTNTVAAEATVPPEISDAFLLLVPIEPSPVTGLRYQVYVLDDTAARQAPGTLAIINFSGLTLSGSIDGKNVTLQAGLNASQSVGKSAAIALRTTFKGRSYQAYASTVELNKNERALLLLLPPFYKGSLETQSRLLVDTPSISPAPALRR